MSEPAEPPEPPEPTPARTGLLLPVASAQQAVQLAAVLRLQADAVPTAGGVLLVPRPGQVLDDAAVTRISRTLRRADLLVLRLADEQVTVQRWRAGRLVDTPHYGVVGGVDGDAERVLLGRLPPAEAAGAASTDGVDRREATRAAVAAARGPVRTWQLVLYAAIAVAAAVVAVLGVRDIVAGTATGGDATLTAVWGLIAVYWVVQLRGLLRRRAREREAAGRPS